MLQKRIDEMTAFNDLHFEKKLLSLKESQESIQSLSTWCLQHRTHHKKIVSIWLKVLKKVNLAHRLALFYLANDVIQYSKRKNYEFVESWGTSLQKATTLVRDEKVKDKILRIFKIWGERGVYDDTFITDLSGLMSTPARKKPVEPPEPEPGPDPLDFQPPVLFSKIRSCHKLEDDTDLRLKRLNESHLSFSDADALRSHLKDRRQGDDVVAEVDEGVKKMDAYMKALEMEIKERKRLIVELELADKYYEVQKGDAQLVVNAYKNFGNRVTNLKRHLDERLPSFACPSPVPSPDINAPSPSPDSDIDLPEDDTLATVSDNLPAVEDYNSYIPGLSDTDPMYAAQDQDQAFDNCFASFLGNGLPFDFQKNLFNDSSTEPNESEGKPIEVINTRAESKIESSISNFLKSLGNLTASNSPIPANPPPVPDLFAPHLMAAPYATAPDVNEIEDEYEYPLDTSPVPMPPPPPPPNIFIGLPTKFPTWESEAEGWEEENEEWLEEKRDIETPESPPMCEKEGFSDPVEYDDSASLQTLGSRSDVDHRAHNRPKKADVDHRLIHIPAPTPPKTDIDHRMHITRKKDVDHRNLISLTGSPSQDGIPLPPMPPSMAWPILDQDYRNVSASIQNTNSTSLDGIDVDYRIPPPPPPPIVMDGSHDNVESVDMDLSDDECPEQNIKVESSPKRDRHVDSQHVAMNDRQSQMGRTDQSPITFNINPPMNKLLAISPLNEVNENDKTSMKNHFIGFQKNPYLGSDIKTSVRPPPLLSNFRVLPPGMHGNRPPFRPGQPGPPPLLNTPPPLLATPSPVIVSSPVTIPANELIKSVASDERVCDKFVNTISREFDGKTFGTNHEKREILPLNLQTGNGLVDSTVFNEGMTWPQSKQDLYNLFINGREPQNTMLPVNISARSDVTDPTLQKNAFMQPLTPKELLSREPPFREPQFNEPSSMNKPHDYDDNKTEHWHDDEMPQFSHFNEWETRSQEVRPPFNKFQQPQGPRPGFNPRREGPRRNGPRRGGDRSRRIFGGRGGARGSFRSPFMAHHGQYGGW